MTDALWINALFSLVGVLLTALVAMWIHMRMWRESLENKFVLKSTCEQSHKAEKAYNQNLAGDLAGIQREMAALIDRMQKYQDRMDRMQRAIVMHMTVSEDKKEQILNDRGAP